MSSKQRVRRFLCGGISVMILGISLIGCGGSQDGNLTFDQFASEKQSFSHPDYSWDMSAADVKEILSGKVYVSPKGADLTYQEIPENLDGYTGSFFPEQNVKFYGLEWEPQYQFKDGELWAAVLSCQMPEGGTQNFVEMVKDAQKAFGPETDAKINEPLDISEDLQINADDFTFTTYTWERTDENGEVTKAVLNADIIQGTVTSMSFYVNKFPKSEE